MSSTAAQVDTGTSRTVTLIGGIGGVLGGTILLTVILGFFVVCFSSLFPPVFISDLFLL